MLWLVKIWQVSSCGKFMQHLETCLLRTQTYGGPHLPRRNLLLHGKTYFLRQNLFFHSKPYFCACHQHWLSLKQVTGIGEWETGTLKWRIFKSGNLCSTTRNCANECDRTFSRVKLSPAINVWESYFNCGLVSQGSAGVTAWEQHSTFFTRTQCSHTVPLFRLTHVKPLKCKPFDPSKPKQQRKISYCFLEVLVAVVVVVA